MLDIIIGRIDAANAGMTRFYTGRPCKKGHIADRYVANGCCVDCVFKIRRVKGASEDWYTPKLKIGAPLKPEHKTELDRLLYGWTELKMREWGYPV